MQMEETVLTFKIPAAAGESYIDIAKCMSMVNRKLMRQQGLWEVLGVQLFADAKIIGKIERAGIPYTCSISGAPRTWVTRNALIKMFHLWIEQQRHAQDSTDTNIKPRWEDFKVYLNENHRTTGDITPTSGHMFGGTDAYMLGEWVHSKIVFEEVDGAGAVVEHEPELHIVGPDNGDTNKGIIHQYAISRAYPVSPDPPALPGVAGSLYAEATDPLGEQMKEVIANMTTDNNESPYDVDDYPGGDVNGNEPLLFGFVANSTGSTNGRKTVMNGFAAPNGLLEVQYALEMNVNDSPFYEDPELWLQVVVGRRSDY